MIQTFPPLATVAPESTTRRSLFAFSFAQTAVVWVFAAVLLWDWGSNLKHELGFWKTPVPATDMLHSRYQRLWPPRAKASALAFLLSRYGALVQTIVVLALCSHTFTNASMCDSTRFVPFGYAVVSLLAHAYLVLRVYSTYGHSGIVLVTLSAMTLLDFGLQLFGLTLIQPTLLTLPTLDLFSPLYTCFLMPSHTAFLVTFLSPTVLHHTLLLMTLYKSWQHYEAEKTIGRRSVMRTLRKDHVFFTLTICLINFLNVILVLQNGAKMYKLIHYFPSMCLTSCFLSRIAFSVRAAHDHHRSRSRSRSTGSLSLARFSDVLGDSPGPPPIRVYYPATPRRRKTNEEMEDDRRSQKTLRSSAGMHVDLDLGDAASTFAMGTERDRRARFRQSGLSMSTIDSFNHLEYPSPESPQMTLTPNSAMPLYKGFPPHYSSPSTFARHQQQLSGISAFEEGGSLADMVGAFGGHPYSASTPTLPKPAAISTARVDGSGTFPLYHVGPQHQSLLRSRRGSNAALAVSVPRPHPPRSRPELVHHSSSYATESLVDPNMRHHAHKRLSSPAELDSTYAAIEAKLKAYNEQMSTEGDMADKEAQWEMAELPEVVRPLRTRRSKLSERKPVPPLPKEVGHNTSPPTSAEGEHIRFAPTPVADPRFSLGSVYDDSRKGSTVEIGGGRGDWRPPLHWETETSNLAHPEADTLSGYVETVRFSLSGAGHRPRPSLGNATSSHNHDHDHKPSQGSLEMFVRLYEE